jgi:hypothetical protein
VYKTSGGQTTNEEQGLSRLDDGGSNSNLQANNGGTPQESGKDHVDEASAQNGSNRSIWFEESTDENLTRLNGGE